MALSSGSTTSRKILAYMVHLFTASSVILALFSLQYAVARNWYNAYLLLVIAVVIDSSDGLLARLIDVKEVLPEIDGNLLDNIVDFLVWSIVPTFIVWRAELLPTGGYDVVVISLICISSTYQFCRSDAKSNIDNHEDRKNKGSQKLIYEDYFFRGFPSAWILLVYFLVFSNTSRIFNAVILTFCSIMSFVPIKCIYPTRTRMWKKINFLTTGIWLAALLATFLFLERNRTQLPTWFSFLSFLYGLYYFIGSIRLTWKLQRRK